MCKWRIKLFFSSPRLAIRARPTLRERCRVRLAWLIKRLLCRLIIITSPDKKNVWNENKRSPREAGPLWFSCKILLKQLCYWEIIAWSILQWNAKPNSGKKRFNYLQTDQKSIRKRLSTKEMESFENVLNVPHFVLEQWCFPWGHLIHFG